MKDRAKELEEKAKEIEELRKELLERGEDFDRAYQEIADCTIEAEYKERVVKMNNAFADYDSAYNNYMKARGIMRACYDRQGDRQGDKIV